MNQKRTVETGARKSGTVKRPLQRKGWEDQALAAPCGEPLPDARSRTDETPAGLCLNCDHRADCALPKAAGGVWFCEEYA